MWSTFLFVLFIALSKLTGSMGQCDLPVSWQRASGWWREYRGDGAIITEHYSLQYRDIKEGGVVNMEKRSYCENMDIIMSGKVTEMIAGFKLIQSHKRYCYYAVMTEGVIFYRETVPIVDYTAYTVEQCVNELGYPAQFAALISYPFSFTSKRMAVNGLPSRSYMFNYRNGVGPDTCTTNSSTATVSTSAIDVRSCYSGGVSYRKPLKTILYNVGCLNLMDIKLTIDGLLEELAVLAYPDSTAPAGFRFYIALCQILDSNTTYDMVFTVDSTKKPTGYTDQSFIDPLVKQYDQLVFTFSTMECQSTISPCKNGGSCIQQFRGYRCLCPYSWTGPTCEESYDDCQGTICYNGVCEDGMGNYKCICDEGYSGQQCETKSQCWSQPCINGGLCENHPTEENYLCLCTNSYFGRNCQFPRMCNNNNPCMNGGSCYRKGSNGYVCACTKGWFGQNCTEHRRGVICKSSEDCQNNGQCVYGVCHCLSHWHGLNCEIQSVWFTITIALVVMLFLLLVISVVFLWCICKPSTKYSNQEPEDDCLDNSFELSVTAPKGNVHFNVLTSPNSVI